MLGLTAVWEGLQSTLVGTHVGKRLGPADAYAPHAHGARGQTPTC